jgi:hypothetical protein
MPPIPRPAPPTEPPPAARPPAARRGLSVLVGGYDIDRFPIRVEPLPHESVPSWITAVAYRYGCTPAQLFQALGIPLASNTPRHVLDHAGEHRDVLQMKLGLSDSEIAGPFSPTTLDQAVADYIRHYPATSCRPTPATKFCPACLRETHGRWNASWSNPVHILCQRHNVPLRNTCPGCGQRHRASPCWVTSTTTARQCPEYTARAAKPIPPKQRPRCGQHLPATDPGPEVNQELHAAQQLLLDLAEQAVTTPAATRLGCGIGIGPRSYFNAVMELIDEAHGFRAGSQDIVVGEAEPWIARAMTIAVNIMHQPRPIDAAVLAGRHQLMNPLGRHTPTSPHKLRRGAHHPVLVAARLSTLAPHLSRADQLTFAISQIATTY